MWKSAEGKEYLVQFYHSFQGMIFKSQQNFLTKIIKGKPDFSCSWMPGILMGAFTRYSHLYESVLKSNMEKNIHLLVILEV